MHKWTQKTFFNSTLFLNSPKFNALLRGKQVKLLLGCLLIWGLFNTIAHSDDRDCAKYLRQGKPGQWHHVIKRVPAQTCPITKSLAQWLHLRDSKSNAMLEAYEAFLRQHSHWPGLCLIRQNGEAKVLKSRKIALYHRWFSKQPPQSFNAKLVYLQTLSHKKEYEKARTLAKKYWLESTLTPGEERAFMRVYAHALRPDDHKKRFYALLKKKQFEEAARMLPLLDRETKAVARAHHAFYSATDNAWDIFAELPSHLKDTPKFLRSQLHWYRKKDDLRGAELIMAKLTTKQKLKKDWWLQVRFFAREALNQDQPRLAYQLLQDHPHTSGVQFAETEWTLGWIALMFLKDHEHALRHFKHMYENVKSHFSLAKAAYWAGRVREAQNEAAKAKIWYERGAESVTSFYGQLCLQKLKRPLHPRLESLAIPANEKHGFENHQFFQAVKTLMAAGLTGEAILFNRELYSLATTKLQRQALMHFIVSHCPELTVHTFKRLYVQTPIVLREGYPIVPMAKKTFLDPAFVLGLIRQESEFDPFAVSSANAMGMMQVIAKVAQSNAKDLKLKYSPKRLLHDKRYNMLIGTHHLERKVKQFNGSYLLAAASYNAGSKPIKRWLERYGDPRQPDVDLAHWIECIPYGETRDYVKYVLANQAIYKVLLKAHKPVAKVSRAPQGKSNAVKPIPAMAQQKKDTSPPMPPQKPRKAVASRRSKGPK